MKNNVDLSPSDKSVIDLLLKLKDSNGTYPSDVFSARRQAYLKQVTDVGLSIGTGKGLKNTMKNGNGTAGAVATVTSKILETALITAIAVEAGTVAYLYRDKISDILKPHTDTTVIEETISPSQIDPSSPSSVELVETIEVPSMTVTIATTPTGTMTLTVSESPAPNVAGDNNSNNNSPATHLNATPVPGGNNGNHYGQTPKPERTKDNNKDNNNNNKNNDKNNDNNGDGKDKDKDKDKTK